MIVKKNSIKNKKIVIIGGAGFIGHNLSLALKRLNANISIIDNLKVNNLYSLGKKNSKYPFPKLTKTIINERIMLSEAKRSLLEYKKRYENSLVRAPVNGRVSSVLITTVGQVVQPGEYLAEIVPEGEDLIIEVMVQLKDIAKVRVGLKAKIAFTAFDSAVFGMFDGEVETVAASTTYDEAREAVYYIARVKVTDEGLAEDQSLIIQSGMESMVSIIGNKRSVISYILNPIKKLNQKAFGE